MIKLSDYVMKFMAAAGVKDVFMLSGGGCMHLVDSLGRNPELKYISCLHEQVVAFAATGYAQYNNNLGVALVTTGPGGTNAITGVAAAWTDSVPLLVLSGQVKRADLAKNVGVRTLGFQELDIVSLVKPITKYAVTVLEPKEIKYHLAKALLLARTGRPGPVWLDLPLDVQATMVNEAELLPFNDQPVEKKDNDLTEKTAQLIDMINQSQRPVIIAGYGIKISRSVESFIKLAGKLNIPILTTWKALDLLPEDFPLYYGRPGCVGQRGANFIQQNSDLVIALGARLDYGQIGFDHESFARQAKKVIIDIDGTELNKFKFKVDIKVKADAGVFINEIDKQIGRLGKSDRAAWLKRCQEWKDKYPVVLPEHWQKQDYVSTYALVDQLAKLSDQDDVFAPENSGAASEIVMQALRLKKGQRVISLNTLGSMGSGLPASIGACVASGRKRTISVNGDGGFMMNIQDLETVARLKLPIKYFILNNDGYGSIRNTQRNFFKGFYVGSDHTSGVTIPDLEKIAAAFGLKYFKIARNSELEAKTKAALSEPGPVLCDVIIDPAEQTMPKLISEVKADGSLVSKPLEDLYPFLPKEELESNMIAGGEVNKRNMLKDRKPYVYEKIMKFSEKLKNGASIAIIQFQYNYACNLHCEHCSVKRFQGKTDKRMFTMDDVRSLSRQADELGLARFVITGGEPLILKDLDELVAAIDPQKFYINVDTNGWFLDEKRAKHLKSIGIDRIQLSLDSLDPALHDAFRKSQGSHARAMKAIDAVQDAGLDIFIQTVVTKSRLHSQEFLDFVKYFNGRGINVFVTYAKPVGAWEGQFGELVDKADLAYMRELEQTYNLCTHLTPAYGLNMGCIGVKGMISVTQYGDVMPCPYIHTSIGNVFDEPLKNIIERGFKIKWFGEYVDTCPIAEDRHFIDKYVAGRIYNKPLPVPCAEVFSEEDRTKKPFNEDERLFRPEKYQNNWQE